jgi:hypothetical protein
MTANPETKLTFTHPCIGLAQQKVCDGVHRCLVYCQDKDLTDGKIKGFKWYCDYSRKTMDWESISAHLPKTKCKDLLDV